MRSRPVHPRANPSSRAAREPRCPCNRFPLSCSAAERGTGFTMRDTFLFVSGDAAFAASLLSTLRSAGKFVVRAHSMPEAVEMLHRWGIDSILVDPLLADDPALAILKGAAAAAGSDFWILDAARTRQLVADLSAAP